MQKITLYKIAEEVENLCNSLIESEGEITQDQEYLSSTLELMIKDKTDDCFAWIQSQQDTIDACKKRIEELSIYKSRLEKSLDKFDSYILMCMDKLKTDSIQGGLCSFKIRKPSKIVKIDNENKIPAEFVTVEVITKIDKNKIKSAIKNGSEVEGASLIDGNRGLIKKVGAK